MPSTTAVIAAALPANPPVAVAVLACLLGVRCAGRRQAARRVEAKCRATPTWLLPFRTAANTARPSRRVRERIPDRALLLDASSSYGDCAAALLHEENRGEASG